MTTSQSFLKKGIFVQKEYLDTNTCNQLSEEIADYRKNHNVPTVFRAMKERSLNYQVIDGIEIRKHLPNIAHIYSKLNDLVNQIYGETLYPLESEKVNLNINITPPEGEYRWHYDRNKLTAIIYLNEVAGGETEIYPNYRVYVKNATWQQRLDNLLMKPYIRNVFSTLQQVKPTQGMLVLMLGNQSLHSVKKVLGTEDRINIIASFDESKKEFSVSSHLDNYLYQEKVTINSDPNYKLAK